MNKFDEKIYKFAEKEPLVMPDEIRTSIDEILAGLPENVSSEETETHVNKIHKISKKHHFPRYLSAAACITFVFFFAMPNLSGEYASAMAKIPVLGDVIKVLTIRVYEYADDRHDMAVNVPGIEDDSDAATKVNTEIAVLTDQIVMDFYNTIETSNGESYEALTLNHDVITNTNHWFSMRLTITETAASSYTYYEYYSIDKQTGEIINLGDLFIDEAYIDALTTEINSQIEKRMKEDETAEYFVSDPDLGDEYIEINSNHNFYINGTGKLVIPFDEYEIAPGYLGCPEFEIPTKVFKNLLKTQYKGLFS